MTDKSITTIQLKPVLLAEDSETKTILIGWKPVGSDGSVLGTQLFGITPEQLEILFAGEKENN